MIWFVVGATASVVLGACTSDPSPLEAGDSTSGPDPDGVPADLTVVASDPVQIDDLVGTVWVLNNIDGKSNRYSASLNFADVQDGELGFSVADRCGSGRGTLELSEDRSVISAFAWSRPVCTRRLTAMFDDDVELVFTTQTGQDLAVTAGRRFITAEPFESVSETGPVPQPSQPLTPPSPPLPDFP